MAKVLRLKHQLPHHAISHLNNLFEEFDADTLVVVADNCNNSNTKDLMLVLWNSHKDHLLIEPNLHCPRQYQLFDLPMLLLLNELVFQFHRYACRNMVSMMLLVKYTKRKIRL